MSSKHSESSQKSFLTWAPSPVNVSSTKQPRQTAYIHNKALVSYHLPQGASSSSPAEENSSSDASPGYATSAISKSPSHLSYHGFDETLYDPPASSTPDLLSPNNSTHSSPEVPSTQDLSTRQLNTLLQSVLDQQHDDQDSSVDDSVSQASSSGKGDYELAVRSQTGSDEQREVTQQQNPDYQDDNDDEGTCSETCWSLSPRKTHSHLVEIYAEMPLTRRNKRKHDVAYGFLEETSSSDGDTTDVEDQDEDPLPNRKKAKYETSISTTVGYQTSETASSRKLRSLSSTTSSFSSTDSTVVDCSAFEHPIIHPPSIPSYLPKSRPEVAEARIQVLLHRESSYRARDGLPIGPFEPFDFTPDGHENMFGIESDFRRKVVEWILDVIPPCYLNSPDLHQHLKHSEETRFHAMYLFSRFFLRLAGYTGEVESKSMREARLEITWDVALCCLAISTKFYHDFLAPLSPIYSRHFLAIAPQLLSHNQFERIQRDVLETFDYEVHGVTPHAFFEELWDALPSLREILRFRRTRTEIRDEMWDLLQLAALEYDIMRFPISLLTAAALVESILITLVYEWEKEDDRSSHVGQDIDLPAARIKKNCTKAREEIKPVAKEICEILGTTFASLNACRRWLSVISRE